jgi:hypothetical protein
MTRSYDLLPKPNGAISKPNFAKLAFSGSLGGGGGGGWNGGGGLPRDGNGKIIWPDKKPHSPGFGAERVQRVLQILGQ